MSRSPTKQKYGEGSWFGVPLKSRGYAVGVVVRQSRKHRGVLFGYFFGSRHDKLPTLLALSDYYPGMAIYVTMFGALGLKGGSWPVIAVDPPGTEVGGRSPHSPIGIQFWDRTRELSTLTKRTFLAGKPLGSWWKRFQVFRKKGSPECNLSSRGLLIS